VLPQAKRAFTASNTRFEHPPRNPGYLTGIETNSV